MSSINPLRRVSTKKRDDWEAAPRYSRSIKNPIGYVSAIQACVGVLRSSKPVTPTASSAKSHRPASCQRSREASHNTGLLGRSLFRSFLRRVSLPYLQLYAHFVE